MYSRFRSAASTASVRLRAMAVVVTLCFFAIIARLFVLMIVEHDSYSALSESLHDLSSTLLPKRGSIYFLDARTGLTHPLAINQDAYILYADTRQIRDDEAASSTAQAVADFFGYPAEKRDALFLALGKRTDPYEPIEKKIDAATMENIRAMNITGIGFAKIPDRFYPEGTLASTVAGFVGKNDAGDDVGRYGIEGYWNAELAGSGGFVAGAKSRDGEPVTLPRTVFVPAVDGADIILTIDRSIEHYACSRLAEALVEFEAESASLIMMEPKTGAIFAMCSLPDFDPNRYNEVTDAAAFNNTTIFTPYEPGSILKPITMAAALHDSAVAPHDTFFDTGARAGLCAKPIKNAGEKTYELQTMTGILQNSINTGMVYIVEKLGKTRFRDAVSRFGFGVKEGIELDTEVSGTIQSLSANSSNRLDCYTATASFGQGLTATPLQMVTAFGALANAGVLMKPYIVHEIRYSDGRVEKTKPKEIREAVSSRAAKLVASMLVQVVDHGYGGRAKVPGYYVAGKTGTAQIPGPGGYTEDTNHSFVGFAPADNPAFVMLVKFEKPKRMYAEVTAAPVFADIAKFALQYYRVPPER